MFWKIVLLILLIMQTVVYFTRGHLILAIVFFMLTLSWIGNIKRKK